MKGFKAFSLLALLAFAAVLSPSRAQSVEDDVEAEQQDDSADDELATTRAFLLVRRKLSDEKLQIGKVTNVLVEIFNAGAEEAKDVSVKEEAWQATAFLTEGQLEAEIESISPGGIESFSYSISPKTPGYFEGRPTLVTYSDGGDAAEPVTTRSPPLYVRVFTGTELLTARALELGASVSLGALKSERDWILLVGGVGALVAVYISLGAYRAAVKTRADMRRRRVLKEFGFDEKTK